MINDVQFEQLYNEYKNLVYNLALSYVQNTDDAADIVQETFVKIYHNYSSYNSNKSSLKTWIYRIAINQALDHLKAKKTKKRFGFNVSLFYKETNEPIPEAISFNHPGVALEDKEALQALFSLINQLPANQKTALILTKIEDRPQKEVAAIMNISIKAVESLLQRAKQTLSKNITSSRRI